MTDATQYAAPTSTPTVSVEARRVDPSMTQFRPTSQFLKQSFQFSAVNNPSATRGASKMSELSRDEISARLEAVEARTDAKLAGITAKLDAILTGQNEVKQTTKNAAWSIIGVIVAVVALIVTIVPIAWDKGLQQREIIRDEVSALQSSTKK